MEPLAGIHHITAVTGNAAANVAFYTDVMGMRLVKKTVNQDDVSSYHLVYGDRWGSPGSELTFFHWPNSGLAKRGAATISPMAFQVAGIESLEWWSERLRQRGLAPSPVSDRDGRTLISFSDPEG
ncbi:MAG TPA: VOC family protein, partial [Candidatus Dormibacteraeota bacterium]|nr:VOC family protein [Candidatus Dormibacteraeota bacterium]